MILIIFKNQYIFVDAFFFQCLYIHSHITHNTLDDDQLWYDSSRYDNVICYLCFHFYYNFFHLLPSDMSNVLSVSITQIPCSHICNYIFFTLLFLSFLVNYVMSRHLLVILLYNLKPNKIHNNVNVLFKMT